MHRFSWVRRCCVCLSALDGSAVGIPTVQLLVLLERRLHFCEVQSLGHIVARSVLLSVDRMEPRPREKGYTTMGTVVLLLNLPAGPSGRPVVV